VVWCATTASALPFDTIVVRFRHPAAVCAGVCPSFEIEVHAQGHVESRGIRLEAPSHFDAKPADLERFTELMAELRPETDRRIDESCEQAKREDGSPDPLSTPRPDDIEVRWYAPDGFVRLTACASDRELRTALQRALRALGADPYTGVKADEGS
jgi:hypothetical protein